MDLRPWILAAAASFTLGACKKQEAPAPVAPPAKQAAPAPAAVDASARSAKLDNSTPSVAGKSDPECAGPIDHAVPAELTIGGKKAELNGYKLTFAEDGRDADSIAVFGVIANVNEDSGENLVNLKKYVEFFKSENVEAILVAGDSGESKESIERALTPLAETGLPVFVTIGNRECRADFNDAISALQKKFANVVNMNKVRHVAYDDADLLSLPGYHDQRYIHCATGCQYFKQDVAALKQLASEAKNPVVLISHGPPKGSAPTAVDQATEAGNVGDSNLNALILEANIPFGVFANIKEAGGRATDLDGTNVIREGTLADKLYLNPGPADSIAWAMNDGTQSVGMVAVLRIEGKQAMYKVFRAKELTAEEKAEAQKLAAAKSPAQAEPASAAQAAP